MRYKNATHRRQIPLLVDCCRLALKRCSTKHARHLQTQTKISWPFPLSTLKSTSTPTQLPSSKYVPRSKKVLYGPNRSQKQPSMSKNADTQQQLSTHGKETERATAKRPGDRRWMLQWLAQGRAYRYGWQELSYPKRLRLVWWSLRGGPPLQKFRECIQDRRDLLASYMIARRAARLL